MTLLPSTLTPTPTQADGALNNDAMVIDGEDTKPGASVTHQILMTTQTGALSLVTAVDEQMYRRLNALQTFLTASLDHHCGLNPRAYRAVESEGFGSRGIVDAGLGLLGRWAELPSGRRAEGCAKVGVEEWVVRSDLEFVGGRGLGYL